MSCVSETRSSHFGSKIFLAKMASGVVSLFLSLATASSTRLWEELRVAGQRSWGDIAVSPDGRVIVAVTTDNGDLVLSRDGGEEWLGDSCSLFLAAVFHPQKPSQNHQELFCFCNFAKNSGSASGSHLQSMSMFDNNSENPKSKIQNQARLACLLNIYARWLVVSV